MKPNCEHTIKTAGRALSLAGLSVTLAAAPARSQELEKTSTYELEGFVVVANRLEMPIQRVGSSVDLLDSFELQKGRDTFLLDALRGLPGLYLRNNGGPGGAFGITTRGLSSNRPAVLLNGVEVSNPASGEMINLGNLFTANLSRVEVLKGPQSSLYGADSLAGVIAIDTLGPDQQPGYRASVAYGSYDTYDFSLGHSGSLGALSWSLDALRHQSEGFSAQDPAYGAAWADDDAYDNTTLSSALEYSLGDDARLFFSAVYLDTYSEFDPGDPAWVWGAPSSHNYSATENLFSRLGAEVRVADDWTSTASFAYSNVDFLSYSAENESVPGSPYYSNGDRYKLDWQNAVTMSERWSFVAGAEHEIEENRSDVGDRDNTSLYMENLLAITDQLDWTIGGRHDENSVYGGNTTYRTTFSYRIESLDARARGSFGTSFQAPTFYQLFNAQYGNRDLKPESGRGWDLGLEKSLAAGRVLITSALFGNKVDDKIVWSGTYRNLDRYESVGIESAIRVQLNDATRLTASHTYSDAEENGSVEATRVPRNLASLGLHWTTLDGSLGLNLDGYFVSSQYSDAGERAADVKLPGYELFNAAATYRISDNYSAWLRVANLLDEEYREISGYETAGRNYQAGLRLSF